MPPPLTALLLVLLYSFPPVLTYSLIMRSLRARLGQSALEPSAGIGPLSVGIGVLLLAAGAYAIWWAYSGCRPRMFSTGRVNSTPP